MYAGDVAGFSDTIYRLQKLISSLVTCGDLIGIKIHLGKTKVVVFLETASRRRKQKNGFDKDREIEIVSFYKFLGLYFTPKLVWTKTKDILAQQATKAFSSIFRYQKNFGRFHSKDMFRMFDTIIKPILCYGSEIWGYEFAINIEKVQVKFCKRYCCLSLNTADFFVLAECGRLPLCITYMSDCVKYWLRLLRMGNYRYPRQCCLMLKRLDDVGRKTWASSIQSLLYRFGFGYAWVTQEVGNKMNLLSLLSNGLFIAILKNGIPI